MNGIQVYVSKLSKQNRDNAVSVSLFLTLCALVLLPRGDSAILSVSAVGVFLLAKQRPSRGAVLWGCFAVLAAVQLLLPHWGTLVVAGLPAWYDASGQAPQLRWSLAPWETMDWLALFLGCLFWAAANQGGRRFRRQAGYAVRGASAFVALVVLTRFARGLPQLANANHIAIFLVATGGEALLRIRAGTDTLALATFILVVAAVATLGAWLPGCLLFSAVVYVVLDKQVSVYRRLLSFSAAFAVCSGVGVALGAFDVRLALWGDVLAMFKETLPAGTGFGSFRWVFPAYAEHLAPPALRAFHPENGYLWLLAEGGVVGLLVPIVLFFRARCKQGVAARAARMALVMFAAQACIDVPWLWTPNLLVIALFLEQGFEWRPVLVMPNKQDD